MNRRLLTALAALPFVASAASASTTGFSATFEERGFPYPTLNRFINPPGFAAPIGFFEIVSDNTVMLTDNEPVQGPAPCDPTTTKALILDGTSRVSEVYMRFPMVARGNMVVFDKFQIGAERSDVRGMQIGVFSGVTRTLDPAVEFAYDGFVRVYGQLVDTGAGPLAYGNVFANDCANGIDNHLTVILLHNLLGGTVMVDIETHGFTPMKYRVGPFQMPAEVKSEGIGGQYARVPAFSGRYYLDGMVCNGSVPVMLPNGSESGGTDRQRY